MKGKTKTRIYTAFYYEPHPLLFPPPMYDPEGRRDYLLGRLRGEFENVDFVGGEFISDYNELKGAEEREDVDGILVYQLGLAPLAGIPWYMREESEIAPFRKKPMLIVTEPSIPYSWMYATMPFCSMARKYNLPVLPIVGTRPEDVQQPLRLFEVLHCMKESKILLVGILESLLPIWGETPTGESKYSRFAEDRMWVPDHERHLERLRRVFGTEVITMTGEEFKKGYFDRIGESQGNEQADKWIDEAIAVRGPTREEIVAHAKWPIALKKAVEDAGADAAVVMELAGGILSLPCLAMSKLKDGGISCSPVADLDSTVTQLMMYYLTGRAGMVNDTLVDPSRGHIIHAYCCAPRKWEGVDSPASPYEIRNCCAGGVTLAVDIRPHYGKFCTSVKVSLNGKLMVVHQGKLVGRIPRQVAPEEIGEMTKVRETFRLPRDFSFDQIGCQNKFVVETDAEKVLENAQILWDMCAAHRNLYVGDFKKELKDLATLLGLEFIEEDRDHLDYERVHRNLYERLP